MVCGHSPRRPWRNLPRECSQLCCHEIANGPLRQKALDKPFAILVLCYQCNGEMNDKSKWPRPRQLSVLKRKSPGDYDLVAFNHLVNPNAPNAITEEEVEAYLNQGG